MMDRPSVWISCPLSLLLKRRVKYDVSVCGIDLSPNEANLLVNNVLSLTQWYVNKNPPARDRINR